MLLIKSNKEIRQDIWQNKLKLEQATTKVVCETVTGVRVTFIGRTIRPMNVRHEQLLFVHMMSPSGTWSSDTDHSLTTVQCPLQVIADNPVFTPPYLSFSARSVTLTLNYCQLAVSRID